MKSCARQHAEGVGTMATNAGRGAERRRGEAARCQGLLKRPCAAGQAASASTVCVACLGLFHVLAAGQSDW
jgi:hypothetical protein